MCLTKNVVLVKQFLVTFQIGTLLRKSCTPIFLVIFGLFVLCCLNSTIQLQ